MDKTAILEFTYQLYGRLGVKNVSMDYLASTLGISKRTLYELFANKHELVELAIREECERMERLRLQVNREFKQPLEQTMVLALRMHMRFVPLCDAFVKEQLRYPKAAAQVERLHATIISSMRQAFHDCVRSGYFRAEKNYKLICESCLHPIIDNHLPPEKFNVLLSTLMRGCCSEKGIFEMDRIFSSKPLLQAYKSN